MITRRFTPAELAAQRKPAPDSLKVEMAPCRMAAPTTPARMGELARLLVALDERRESLLTRNQE